MKKFIYLLFLLPIIAIANPDNECTGDPHHCYPGDAVGIIDVDSNASSDSSASSSSDSRSVANVGDNINRTDFVAFSTTFPGIGECLLGAQGGVKDGNVAGFLGFNQLDDNCFYTKLGEAESNIPLKARLTCGSKKYRDAVAFDSPRAERQQACIDYVTEVWKKEAELLRECKTSTGTCAFINGQLRFDTGD